MKLVLFVLLSTFACACIVPENAMILKESATLCSDVYYLNNGITIAASNVKVVCEGTVIKSWRGGRGITIENVNNVTVTGCRIMDYNIGIIATNTSQLLLEDNHLIRNQIGVRFVNVKESATYNHDVSLNAPLEVMKSEGNVISATNKAFRDEFCKTNFCNKQRNTVEHFMTPKITQDQMQSWLSTQVGKSKPRLFNWVFGNLV